MTQDIKEFDRLYAMLNKEQKLAVDTIEGPVMVIAGPGTGKTQILTLRIANILKQTDVPADAILALTFTNAGAANMRKRLVSIIGSDAYRVSIFTFHSFANHIIENHPERFNTLTGRSNCSEVERIDIIRSILDAGRYEIIKPLHEPYHNVPKIISGLSHLKREGLSPEAFQKWIESERSSFEKRDDVYHQKGAHAGKMKGVFQKQLHTIEKNEEFALLYAQYQNELLRRKRYDFDDSLLFLIEAMEDTEDFLRELQEEYQYFLVDEHQDTNGAQNRILELLASFFERPNLFVVGDEKQAIFRFQGASLSNFLYFEEKFSDVKRITLETNYRSHQGVLDVAHTLIEKNTEGIQAPLTAFRSPKNTDLNLKVFTFDADDEELLFLAESIKGKLRDGVPAHEIAVLFRNNRDVEAISDYFERLNIPFLVESGHGVLDDSDIQKLNILLKALTNLSDDDALSKVLFIDFLKIHIADIYTILREVKREKKTIFEVLQTVGDLELQDSNSLKNCVEKLHRWKRIGENEPFLYLFETVVRESGLLEHIQHSSFHTEKFDKLVRLFDEMKSHTYRNPFFSLEDYDTFLRILNEHNLTLEAKSRQIPNSVRLMTAHKAKGLEFDYVFIVHAFDGHWGGKRAYNYLKLPYRKGITLETNTDDIEDERRLFYVAITRARKDVYVSYARLAPDGRDRVPSQFIEEVHEALKTNVDGETLGYAGKRPPLFVERIGRHGAEKYLEFVKATFYERGLSATAINNYLTCPWKWFYQNFFYTQFVPSTQQLKGTAVHTALEIFFNKRNTQNAIPFSFLLNEFKNQMELLDIEPSVAERMTKETGKALEGWYRKWHQLWEPKTKNEILVKGILLDNSIRLTGKFDKLECLDERCSVVRVVDYKTGKPKSRNEIEGKTKTAQTKSGSGGYKRQLVFYKLLLNSYAEGKYHMKEAVLDFIEPMPSGTYKQEVFEITNTEVTELQETVRSISKEITTLSFWNKRCDDSKCSACTLREMMGNI